MSALEQKVQPRLSCPSTRKEGRKESKDTLYFCQIGVQIQEVGTVLSLKKLGMINYIHTYSNIKQKKNSKTN